MPHAHRHLLTVSGIYTLMSEDPSVSGMYVCMYVCMYVGDDASVVNLT